MNPSPTQNWRELYPFQSNFFSTGGYQMHYVDEGRGKPVLCVHGNPTWSFYYRNLILGLRDHGRFIAMDHLGCGLSDKPQDYPYQLDQHIQNLCDLIDFLDLDSVTLVAHDWGGAIGLGALLARRARFSSIVLLNTGAFPPPFIPLRIRVCRWPLLGLLAVRGFNAFARAATLMATEHPGGLPAQVAAGYLHPYDNWANRVAVHQFVQDIPVNSRQKTWVTLQSIENQLGSLQDIPKKLIWGMKDWCFTPECLDRFLQHWPEADVVRMDNAGHYVLEDATENVVTAIKSVLDR